MTGGEEILSVEANAAGGRFDEAESEASESALTGAGLTDQAEGFAGVYVKGDVVNRANFMVYRTAEERLCGGEDFRQIADFYQRHEWMVASAKLGQKLPPDDAGCAGRCKRL